MKITATDPMSGNDVANIDSAPFVVEGSGSEALKIYFESEQNKQAYVAFMQEYYESDSFDICNTFADNETTGTIN
jgi:hypothetical protein